MKHFLKFSEKDQDYLMKIGNDMFEAIHFNPTTKKGTFNLYRIFQGIDADLNDEDIEISSMWHLKHYLIDSVSKYLCLFYNIGDPNFHNDNIPEMVEQLLVKKNMIF